MAPSVSPKKSWEGFAGSVTACAVGADIMFATLFSGTHWWEGALFGLAVVCSATLGDLGESMIKRDIGIKDMGALIEGHGGVLDRVDSLIYVAPLFFHMARYFHGL
jgi:phosphatidate cytidylyltransferase